MLKVHKHEIILNFFGPNKSNIEYDFQKSRVEGPWDRMVSVSAKKVLKKFHACVPLTGIRD
jgi:hypothetical protein